MPRIILAVCLVAILLTVPTYHDYPAIKLEVKPQQAIPATWTGSTFTCPAGTDIYASEDEALQGNDEYAHCVIN
jgi:hypothetical protein